MKQDICVVSKTELADDSGTVYELQLADSLFCAVKVLNTVPIAAYIMQNENGFEGYDKDGNGLVCSIETR